MLGRPGLLVLCAGLVALGCSAAEGECSYDTDCPEICDVCDPVIHRCITDQECVDKLRKKCHTDDDCDPLNEYCLKEAGQAEGTCTPYERDGGPDPDGDGQKPDEDLPCPIPDPDCSGPGLNQGADVDGDQWGECCDCDDHDPTVRPGGRELTNNCKDDDCDPGTPDGDIDGDGFVSQIRVCDPGEDCDDRNASVYPGATEICDGLDNDCDGPVDEDCNQDGGIPDGADLPPECPDLSGEYHIDANCMAINDADSQITQDGCDISINFSGIGCNGTIDAGLNLHINCAQIPVTCSAHVNLSGGFLIRCSEECTFFFTPIDQGTVCTHHQDPVCGPLGKLCGVVGKDGIPEIKCASPVPGGLEPGFYCDPPTGRLCVNSLCIDAACGAICQDDSHCSSLGLMTCQQVLYNDGLGTSGQIDSCVLDFQDETRCGRNPDCGPDRVCSYRPLDNQVTTVCRTPNPGGNLTGEACNQPSECANNLCVCADGLCDGQAGLCAEPCTIDADCLQGHMCDSVNVPDLNSVLRPIQACIRDPAACGRDADCTSGQCCFLLSDGDDWDGVCNWGSVPDPNGGQPCTGHAECCNQVCLDYPGYCMGLCIIDDDCPGFDGGACADDAGCELGYLCDQGTCSREFSCATRPFFVRNDDWGNPIFDTANICVPERRVCQVNGDCRSGEACKLYYNQDATQAQFQCEAEGPGTGGFWEDCHLTGNNACRTRLCLQVDGGGEGQEFCTRACVTADDCEDPATYYCATIPVDLRPGFTDWVSVCAECDL